MKGAYVIINLLLAVFDAVLTVTGAFDWNLVAHGHIMDWFRGLGDGALGLFWMVCIVHDLLILNALWYVVYRIDSAQKSR